MGLAIAGMHYTGMAAARSDPHGMCKSSQTGLSEEWLAVLVVVAAVCALGIALLTSTFDVRLESRTAKLAGSLALANHELTSFALHDSLTKLPNRGFLQKTLDEIVETRPAAATSLLFIDLDGFKAVNDAYGHGAGNDVLTEVAQRMISQLGSSDLVAGLGETSSSFTEEARSVTYCNWRRGCFLFFSSPSL